MNLAQHHLKLRGRRGLEPYPHPHFWKRILDKVIYLVGLITPAVLMPQLIEVWTTHDVQGLSLITWLGFTIINLIWLLYGIVHREGPIIISNGLLTLANFGVTLGIMIL